MYFTGDYHTHTHYSDGHQSIEEIVQAAEAKGMEEVAITDHGPSVAVIGVKNAEVYLEQRKKIDDLNNSDKYKTRILLGAEANIRDMQGNLDIPQEVINKLDILIVGLHPYTITNSIQDYINLYLQNSLRHLSKKQREKAIKANTLALVAALSKNPQINILSHPGLFFIIDIVEVANVCINKDVLFEINCGHEHPGISDIIKAEETGVQFIINSDSHFQDSIGNFEYGYKMMQICNIRTDRVYNFKS